MGAGITLGNYTTNTPITSASRNSDNDAIEAKFGGNIHRDDIQHNKCLITAMAVGNGSADDDFFHHFPNPAISASCDLVQVGIGIVVNGGAAYEIQFQVEKATANINFAAATILVAWSLLAMSGADPGTPTAYEKTYVLPALKTIAAGEVVRVRMNVVTGGPTISHVETTCTFKALLEE